MLIFKTQGHELRTNCIGEQPKKQLCKILNKQMLRNETLKKLF
jgi:hypothetical protein